MDSTAGLISKSFKHKSLYLGLLNPNQLMLKYNWLILFATIATGGWCINAPTPASPANGATFSRFTTSITASNVTGAISYEFEIDTLPAMNSGWLKTFSVSYRSVTSPVLQFNKTYYWRVRCSDSTSTSTWSPSSSFSLINGALGLNKPVDNTTGPITALACLGIGYDSSIQYLYEVDTTLNFTSPLHKIYTASLSLDSADIFTYSRTIYWRATATNLMGDTFQWSVIRKYSIHDGPALSAGNVTYLTDPLHKLVWQNAGLSYLEVQLDTTSAFNSPLLEKHLINKGITLDSLKNLLFGKYYYSRIRGYYGHDTSVWSGIKKLLVMTNGRITTPSFNGTTINAISNINLAWSQLDGTTCRAKLYADSTETVLLADTVPSLNSFKYIPALQLDKWYQLQVTYYHEKDTAPTLISYFKTYAGQVNIYEPSNNALNIPVEPRLRFGTTTWATGYILEIDTGTLFPATASSYYQQFTQFDSLLGVYLTVSPILHYNQKYVMRVSAIMGPDTAEGSLRNFTTVSAPTNYYPPNNFIGIGTSTNALVKSIDSSLFVQWELDTVATFTSPHLASGTDVSIPDDFDPKYVNLNFPSDLLFHAKYYWRSRCINSVDTSSWSTVFSFTTTTDMQLNTPVNGAINIPVHTFLDWSIQGSNLDQQYQYQIETDSLFDNKPIITLPAEHFSEDSFVGMYATTYYWRARAFNAIDTSEWSKIYTFRTANLPVIGTVAIAYPANGASVATGIVSLGWNLATNATSYDIEIALNDDYSSIVATGTALGTGAQFSGTQPHTKYYWRVRGKNSATNGPWSGRWFETGVGVGIDEVNFHNLIQLSPNPADDSFAIHATEDFDINVYSMEGRLMYTADKGKQTKIDTQLWPEGIYIITLKGNNQLFQQKITIIHSR
jgi:hypothetical protein